MPELEQIITLVHDHAWLELSALLLGFVVRVLKSDTIGPVVPKQHRAALAWGLGLAAGVLERVIGGHSFAEALVTAIGAPMIAMAGHHTCIEWLRKGRELPVPGLMKGPAVMYIPALLFVVAASPPLTGCGAQLESARSARVAEQSSGAASGQRDEARCTSLDDQQRFWGGLGVGASVAAGAAGVSTIPVESHRGEVALAATSVGVAVIAATAQYIAGDAQESWARECSR